MTAGCSRFSCVRCDPPHGRRLPSSSSSFPTVIKSTALCTPDQNPTIYIHILQHHLYVAPVKQPGSAVLPSLPLPPAPSTWDDTAEEMSERVHPAGGDAAEHQAAATPGTASKELLHQPTLRPDERKKNQPPPGTYVIQVPKEQIFRTPTPETERRFKEYSRGRRGRRGRSCCRCLCLVGGVLLLLTLLLAAAAGVLYLVFRPQLPKYAVQSVSVRGFNLTADAALSPEFDVVVRAENPNKKVKFRYRGGGSAVVSHSGVDLCRGSWPSFHQGTRNVTLIRTALTGSGIRLSGAMRRDLAAGQRRGAVPLEVRARVPVRIRFGAVTTWTITAKVRCDLTVDKLAASSRVVSASCGVKVKLL